MPNSPQTPTRGSDHRASPPQLPTLTPEQLQSLQAAQTYRDEREQVERRSVMRGLILLALLILFVSMLRAGLGRVFPHNWWRP
jgi:hypothetical protein